MFDRARAADASGVDRVVVSDHVVLGENLEAYGRSELGGVEGGRQPTGPDGLWLEPMTVLSMVAALTNRVRLGTGVLQAALRRPVVLAKAAATLDVLSGGRLELGVGVGWQREEYEAAGLEFAGRGRTLDHTLEVCQALWQDGGADFDSAALRFSAIHCSPKPRQAGGVPIWVSGTANRRVLDRLARFGSGWIPWGPDRVDPGPGVAAARQALADAGREAGTLCVRGVLTVETAADGAVDLERTMAPVPGLIEAGVTDFSIQGPVPSELAAATDYLSALVGGFRTAAGQ
jgi:probable F420-dependent oxidoreductase